MNTTSKKKLCWNCDASVSKAQSNCPYCGVYLHRADDESPRTEEEDDGQEPASPPYLMNAVEEQKNDPPRPPYIAPSSQVPPTIAQEHPEPPPKENTSTMKYALLSLIALVLGIVSLLFSLILLFFSNHGILTLRWSAELWYFYLIISIPLLFVGWFALKHIKD